MPSSERDRRQAAQPTGQSVLRIPQAEAEARLTARITIGCELLNVQPPSQADLNTLGHKVEQWRDFNRTWLDRNIGGEAADEYRTASTHYYGFGMGLDPATNLRFLRLEVESEISKLESIRDRLALWAQEPVVPTASQSSAHDSDLATNRKAVMVIYGHDQEANDALFSWLRAIGLQPKEWSQLVHASGDASPYIGQVLERAFKDAQAVIAFFTPDEFVLGRNSAPTEKGAWRLQARPNVLMEAGMALVTHPKRTVLVVLGPQELPSDLAGRHYIRLSHTSSEALNTLAIRLHGAGCDTDLTGTDWLKAVRFPDRDSTPQYPAVLVNDVRTSG